MNCRTRQPHVNLQPGSRVLKHSPLIILMVLVCRRTEEELGQDFHTRELPGKQALSRCACLDTFQRPDAEYSSPFPPKSTSPSNLATINSRCCNLKQKKKKHARSMKLTWWWYVTFLWSFHCNIHLCALLLKKNTLTDLLARSVSDKMNMEKTPVASSHQCHISVLFTVTPLTPCSLSPYGVTWATLSQNKWRHMSEVCFPWLFPIPQIFIFFLPAAGLLAMYPIIRASTSVLRRHRWPPCRHICFGASECKFISILQSILGKN